MSHPVRLLARAWALAPVGALGFLIWVNHARIQRVEYVFHLPGRADAGITDPASPTGYPNGQRELIVPERNERSFDWIAQTQQMFARHEWRVRHVDYENAPFGHSVSAASPYRWWLGAMAWLDHAISGRPIGLSVERAALWADPALHGLLLAAGTLFVAWQFGGAAAALFAVALVGLFPLGAGFLPGVPDDHGLAGAWTLASLLLLLAGMNACHAGRPALRWFALAGVGGGLGVWVSVPLVMPLVAGVSLGALAAAVILGRQPAGPGRESELARAWRVWAGAGGATILAGYLIEFFPAHLGAWRLQSVHPVYGLAWVGAAELVARTVTWIERGPSPRGPARGFLAVVLALAAVAAVPVAMNLSGNRGFLAVDVSAFRLTNLPHGVVAATWWSWLMRDGFTPRFWAVLLPAAFVVPAGWLVLRKSAGAVGRASLALVLGPALVALAWSGAQLSWWHLADLALITLAVRALPIHLALQPRFARGLWTALAAAVVLPGLIQLRPERIATKNDKLTAAEAQELIERDLAHGLARQAGGAGAVVFAPPNQTVSLAFYGGLAGIGTLNADNDAGLRAVVTLASVSTLPEAQLLVQARNIRYLVLPSWDSFFDDYARLYLVKAQAARKSVFIPELLRLNLPPWLRPWPWPILDLGGYEGQLVRVFEVVPDQAPPVAMGRLAEYLVETGELDRAAGVAQELRRFPGDVGALAARAQVAAARDDAAEAGPVVETLLARLAAGGDKYLLWDRRVSLAIVLARAGQTEPAKAQVHRCLAELDAAKARTATAGSLYNFLVLTRAYNDPITDPKLQAQVLDLLPPELRSRF